MLILSRKLNEKIVINDDIVIQVLEIDGDKVKIGIDAPKNYKIVRSELIEETKQQNVESAKSYARNMDLLKLIIKNVKEKQ